MRTGERTKGESLGGGRVATTAHDELIGVALALLDTRRRALGCSQALLAEALGVSASVISRLFAGRYGQRGGAAALATQEGLRRIELALRVLARDGKARRSKSKHSAHAPGARVDTAVKSVLVAALAPTPYGALASDGDEKIRILIAEDEADILELYQMVLLGEDTFEVGSQPRYAITVARTAEDCLAKLRYAAESGSPFDLLLMDLGIGDPRRGTGEGTLLLQLRALPELLPRRILVVSGVSPYLLERREDDLAALGAAFLPKPFDIEMLSAAVAWLTTPGSPPLESLRYFS